MSKRIVTPDGYKAPALYSHAIVKSGTQVHFAGQVGSLPDGSLPADGGQQVEQAFENVRAVAEACGGTMADVVKLTIFVTSNDLRTQIADQRRRRWPDGERPATTYLIVAGLATPEHLVELDAVAVIE
jgi:2-iminobutanoate/2-iminopropanoate deaminase